MEQTAQYKSLFYNQKTSHRFYEGGAHFSYFSLVKVLNKIKDDLNKNREKDVSLIKEKEEEKEKKREIEKEKIESIEKKEIKKVNIPLLSKVKNKSMNYLLNDNTLNTKKDITHTKIINEQPQKESNNINLIKLIQNSKKLEYSNNYKRSNKYFNNSIYNNSNNSNNVNMPMIYNKKNKSENKTTNIGDKNIILKKNSVLEPLKNKYKNTKMSSTIGFNENEKYYNYYLINNHNELNKSSRNKNVNASCSSISQSLNKYNINNNLHMIDKFNLINNFNKNKNFTKNLKMQNSNSIDYNINHNYIKLNRNKNNMNYTKVNFSNDKRINGNIFINDDKKRERERMNLSIINFSMIKRNNKFLFDKNKFFNYQ